MCVNSYENQLKTHQNRVSSRLLKKCIFLKCFSESFPDYIPENVVWGNLYLYEDISMKESNFDSNTISKDERKSHLNDKNNYNMYLFLKDIIDKDDFTPREIKMEKYFE